MSSKTVFVIACVVLFVGSTNWVDAQESTLRLFQERDGATPRLLTPSERATLGDPLFNLLLKEKAHVTDLQSIQDEIQPDSSRQQVFVVDEHIGSDRQAGRRCVIAFSGTNGDEALEGNVMLSIVTGPHEFPRQTSVEGWGWDNHRGRYNYYKLDGVGVPFGGQMTWKFRGSSDNSDLLDVNQRQGTCLGCHLNGAPIMKELLRPWNNWHSLDFNARYLHSPLAPIRWPISHDARFTERLRQAEELEPMILRAIRRFNTSRINQALRRRNDSGDIADRGGVQTVIEGRRVLRPIFEATEFNIISALQRSSLDPWGGAPGPAQEIVIPGSFFLNVGIIAGGGAPGYNGLKIREADAFNRLGKVRKEEYGGLVRTIRLRMNSVEGRDALFAWFVPEPSHSDVDLVDQLLKRGVVTPHFLSAAMALDLESPVYLSQERANLLRHIPDRFDFEAVEPGVEPLTLVRDESADHLTRLVVQSIEAIPSNERSQHEVEFLQLLKSDDARSDLRDRVIDLARNITMKLESNDGDVRQREIRRLFIKSLRIRSDVLAHPAFSALDETGGQLLFPLPVEMPSQ